MPGRLPKPTALKELTGNPGKRPLNKREPKARSKAAPRCPEWLDEEAKREWRRIIREYRHTGLITTLDRGALAGLCHLYSRAVRASKDLARTGLLTKTSNGNIIQNPLVGIANRAWIEYLRFAQEFGLTPSSRTRLMVPEKAPEDVFEAYLSELGYE